MKREPYTTKLTSEELQKVPVSMVWGEKLTPHLAVISKIIKGNNSTYWLMLKSISQRGRTVIMPRWARKTTCVCGDLYNTIEIEDIWYDPYDIHDPLLVWLEVGDHIVYFTNDDGEVSDRSWVMGREYEGALIGIARTIHYRVTANGEEVYRGRSYHEALNVAETSRPEVGQLGKEMSKVLGTSISDPVEVVIEYRQGLEDDWETLPETSQIA